VWCYSEKTAVPYSELNREGLPEDFGDPRGKPRLNIGRFA